MQFLEEQILKYGKICPHSVLKVDSFLNHQVNVSIVTELANAIYEHYKDSGVTKILTVESSGIPLACMTAAAFKVPFIFAKKKRTINLSEQVFKSAVHSYTTGKYSEIMVSAEYLGREDNVLIVDDFLAKGSALRALIEIVEDSGATLVGTAVAIEKGFQGGGDMLRKEGFKVYSLSIIDKMTESKIIFRED
ncbi:MAG: xanthine phosphoribosyltransferase [Clostridia bacterium]|jgi:xanthine phosphoribosyltransferase|nr:xanthine phosphoribosyltransferase [Clostridia bacterium]OQC14936.1 MAG: Xanthine phosphoribosyltransferase [Firmicutes bacterium ADurb.Bin080]